MTPPAPCRLSVILAREAPVGVIFRRGPSKLVELIKWNTDADTFERGQWFKGRIYDTRSDLSPDGSMIIYFAAKFKQHPTSNPDGFPAWTAISRPPWLTALALWPVSSVWPNGGGLFRDHKTLWLNHTPASAKPDEGHKPHGLRIIPNPDIDSTAVYVFPQRFVCDGWVVEDEGWLARRTEQHGLRWSLAVWAKADPRKRRMIVMRGYLMHHWVAFALRNPSSGAEFPIENAEWADWDQRGRLVFARYGKLFVGDFDGEEQMTPRELADFNADTFEPRQAPAGAQEW